MQASVEALKNLVDSLAEQSEQPGLTINIQLIGFNNEAVNSNWLTLTPDNVGELKSFLDDLARNPAGQTNYEAAFEKLLAAFQAPPEGQGDVHNSVYFLSDGAPNFMMVEGKALSFTAALTQGKLEELGYNGLFPAGKDSSGKYTGFPTEDQQTLFAQEHPDLVQAAGGSVYKAFMAEATRQWSEFVADHGGSLFDQLTKLGVEINAGGFAGPDLDQDTLDKFDNTDGSQILHNADDLNALLNPGDVIPGIYAGQDAIYAGAGNDIAFGDHVTFDVGDDAPLDGWDALQAAVNAAGGDASSKEGVYQFITEHPDFISSLGETEHDQADLMVGGSGDDILAGMGGDDVLLGDGDNASTSHGTAAYLNTLLGDHAQGSDLAAGVHDLIQHGATDEIRHFTDAIENAGMESDQDGNDYLFGGSGDDVIFGMGGNDALYGGEGSDLLFGGTGDDFLDGGNDDAVDHLYGGSGNDILVYHANDVIDGGSGIDVLLVGDADMMDRLFQNGGMADDVSNVELIVSGNIHSLTSMAALENIGVTMQDNGIALGEGWMNADSMHDGYVTYTNGDVTIEISADSDLDVLVQQHLLNTAQS